MILVGDDKHPTTPVMPQAGDMSDMSGMSDCTVVLCSSDRRKVARKTGSIPIGLRSKDCIEITSTNTAQMCCFGMI